MVHGRGKSDYFRRSELLENAVRFLAKPLNLPNDVSSRAPIDLPLNRGESSRPAICSQI